LVGRRQWLTKQDVLGRPQSGILILVATKPPTPKIWWPNSNFSGQSKKKLVAKGKRIKTNIFLNDLIRVFKFNVLFCRSVLILKV
jgi:hypothetical protein